MKGNLDLLVVGFILFAGATCGALAKAEPNQVCPRLDTQKILDDLKNPFRVDRQWFETLVKKLVYQLDCERKARR